MQGPRVANRKANLCIEHEIRKRNYKIMNLVTISGCYRLDKEVLMTDWLAVPNKMVMSLLSCHC